jgi:hypothetical protein
VEGKAPMEGNKLLPWIVVTGLVLFAGGTCARLESAERTRDVAEANHRVALDTTRQFLVDDTRALNRLVTQRQIRVDSLSGILGTTKDSITALLLALKDRDIDRLIAVQALDFRMDSLTLANVSLNNDVTTLTREGAVERVVGLDIESEHIRGDIDITIPSDPDDDIDIEFVSLAADPFTVFYTISCSGTDAVVAAQAPDWINMTLREDASQVDPNICNPPSRLSAPGSVFSINAGKVTWGVAGAALGFLLGR